MDRREWSLQDAKNHFSSVVTAASRGTAQTVTKRGKPAVVVLAIGEYERLTRKAAEPRPSFAEHLLAMPKDDGVFERAKTIGNNPSATKPSLVRLPLTSIAR